MPCCCIVTKSCQTQGLAAHLAPLSMGFPRQEHWSGLPFPSPGDLPDPEIEPMSLALGSRFFTTILPGKPPTHKCAIAPGRRAGAPPVWKLTRSFPVQACKHPPAASLFSPAFRA